MATFKDRALTLATVGALSGVALTIATNGVLQLPESPVGPPTPPPVAAAPRPYYGGPLDFQYSNQYRFRTEVLWHLGIDVTSDHVSLDPSTYHTRSRLSWLLDIGTESEGTKRWHYAGGQSWALGLSGAGRWEPAEPVQVTSLDAGLAVQTAVRGAQALRALSDHSLALGFAPETRSRALPTAADAKVYAHILSAPSLAISTDSRHSTAMVAEYAHRAAMPAGLQVDTRHSVSTAEATRHSHRGGVEYGVGMRYAVDFRPVPTTARNDDEEVLLLLAQLLAEEDDG